MVEISSYLIAIYLASVVLMYLILKFGSCSKKIDLADLEFILIPFLNTLSIPIAMYIMVISGSWRSDYLDYGRNVEGEPHINEAGHCVSEGGTLYKCRHSTHPSAKTWSSCICPIHRPMHPSKRSLMSIRSIGGYHSPERRNSAREHLYRKKGGDKRYSYEPYLMDVE